MSREALSTRLREALSRGTGHRQDSILLGLIVSPAVGEEGEGAEGNGAILLQINTVKETPPSHRREGDTASAVCESTSVQPVDSHWRVLYKRAGDLQLKILHCNVSTKKVI